MKIAFSTLGCPGFSLSEIVCAAKDFNYDGVEIRGLGNEIYAPRAKAFLPQHIDETINALTQKGLQVPILTTAAYLHKPDGDCEKEVMDYITLAQKLSPVATKYIRVLGDTDPEPRTAIDMNLVADRLKMLGARAQQKGLRLLIETNGAFADSGVMLELLRRTGTEGIGVLWDIHHPYRYFNETPQFTYDALKPYIRHVHIKDSIRHGDGVKYKLAGEGDVPLVQCLDILKNDGYAGYVSLEWVKRWYSDLEEPGIVFMQYINYIKRHLNSFE